MGKHRTGVTVNGIQETCRWDKPSPCPRHRIHSALGKKINFTIVNLEEPEHDNDALTLEEYNNTEQVIKKEDLNAEQKASLNRNLYLKIGEKYYRKNNNGYTMDEFRYIESAENLTEEEFNHLLNNEHLIVDDVIYRMEDDGYLAAEHKDVDAPYMRLEGWFVESANMNIPEYIKHYGGKEETLDYNVEQAYMNGGCAVYALALKELHPEYEIAVEKTHDGGIITYEHVFCVNRETGEAYDSRGRFNTPEDLYDYSKDPLTLCMNQVEGSTSHEFWDTETLYDFINDGFFTYEDTENDVSLTMELIKQFKTRFN